MSDVFFEPDCKRRKLVNSINLTNTNLGVAEDDVDVDEKTEPMGYDELVDVQYKDCFACEHMHAKAIENNESYGCLMKLYTTNSANICKDAIYKKIHTFFHENIVPDLVEIRKEMTRECDTEGLVDLPPPEWSVESIKEHFETHTNYPTDELLFQVRVQKAIRNKLSNNIVEKRVDGTLKFNHKNLDAFNKIEKAIVEIMKTKKDISGMVGYSRELDY